MKELKVAGAAGFSPPSGADMVARETANACERVAGVELDINMEMEMDLDLDTGVETAVKPRR
jgi:hypothetical protein